MAVAGCIRTHPEAADDTLTQLADVFRYTPMGSRKEWVMLAEEIDLLRAYLAVERARFGDRLLVTIGGEAAGLSLPTPTMILQPLAENAVKHGASLAQGVGKITIVAVIVDDVLRVEVRDNGPGFAAGFRLHEGGAGVVERRGTPAR